MSSYSEFSVSECISQAEVNRHLELGKQYLAKGQLGDALSHYHSAVGKILTSLQICFLTC